jgi:SAM-dependent methyltransferase
MTNEIKQLDLYQLAGITNLAEFYRLRYASGEMLDADYFDAVNRFDIRWSRTMWVYDNVRPGALVLDLGCGAGLLSLLKRKGATVIGVDISADCARLAVTNGYASALAGSLAALPFDAQTFDYVVSLDVMGHIGFSEKNAVLAEIKRVLRPNGITLHGVESMNRAQQKDYDEMTPAELQRFVGVDGHVGMEDETANRQRFGKFFAYVQTAPRYSVCVPCEELIKLADDYGLPRCDQDFLDYLRGLSFTERRAFNMAMGYVFQKVSDAGISMPASGYLLVMASDQPVGSMYGEDKQRDELLNSEDQNGSVCYNSGWYAAENFPPVGRWMARTGLIRLKTRVLSRIEFELTCHMPDVEWEPLHLEFRLNGHKLGVLEVATHGMQSVALDVPQIAADDSGSINCLFEIRADRTWQPRSTNRQSNDDRELSIAVFDFKVVG